MYLPMVWCNDLLFSIFCFCKSHYQVMFSPLLEYKTQPVALTVILKTEQIITLIKCTLSTVVYVLNKKIDSSSTYSYCILACVISWITHHIGFNTQSILFFNNTVCFHSPVTMHPPSFIDWLTERIDHAFFLLYVLFGSAWPLLIWQAPAS